MRGAVLLALLLPSQALAGVVINEILNDPVGVDTGLEWIEIVNTSAAPVDITGWEIRAGTMAPAPKYTFGALILQPGQRVVVGEAGVVGADYTAVALAMGDNSGSGDVVELCDAIGIPIDTLVYGPNNNDMFVDDTGAVATSLAPTPPEGSSLARIPDGVDTDASAVDFQAVAVPTQGAANGAVVPPDSGDTGGPAAPLCDAAGVVINELVSDPSLPEPDNEWVELYNPGAVDVDVSGWVLESGTSSYSGSGTIPAGTVVAAGDWLVVGQTGIAEVDVLAPGFTLGNAGSSSDAVRLTNCSGVVVDTVVYGTPNTDGWLDDTGVLAASFAPSPLTDASIGRAADGVDTDQSGVDFVEYSVPTPGAANAPAVGGGSCDDAVAGAAVVINELLSDPAGDPDEEWVELYNGGSTSIDISSWAIRAGTSSFGGTSTLPEGTVIAPGQFLVVAKASIPEADVVAPDFTLGNAGSSADGVQIQDCNGTPVDTVIYGTPNSDAWVDDTGAVATSLAPVATNGASLARVADGVDTDASAADFGVAALPTPGTSNTAAAPNCGGPGSGLKINEFLFDPDGADAGYEWVEIYGAGGAAVDVSGWRIQKATSAFSDAFVFPDGATIDVGQFVLVGEELVPDADFVGALGLGNAGTSADGVRLVDCSGVPVDTVIYGDENSDLLLDDTGAVATSLAPAVGSGSSIQRVQDGYDTDRSGVDFAEQVAPTPGAPNPPLEPVVCVPADGTVKLNEFVPNPASSDTSNEWIELYNAGPNEVDLSGWGIDTATSTWGTTEVTFVGGTKIAAGDWLVVGGSLAPVDIVAEFSLGNATSGADGIRLLDCEGTVADTVIYGTTNPDGLTDDAGQIVPSAVPGEAGSLSRVEDGQDSDVPDDWAVRGAPTPGASNHYEEPVITDDGSGGCGCGSGPPDASDPPGGCSTEPVASRAAGLLGLLALTIRRRKRLAGEK
jgi:hypothetical protein